MFLRFLLFLSLVFTVSGCSSGGNTEDFSNIPVETLYNDALDYVELEDWTDAIKNFETIDREYAYSFWGARAKIMLVYSAYQTSMFDEAILFANEFIIQYPKHQNISYAYYLIALSYYKQIYDPRFDQSSTIETQKSLQYVVDNFAGTDYAKDSQIKLYLIDQQLASKDLIVGRFYQSQHNYVASINRFRNVVNNYSTTIAVYEALHRLAECYLSLGLIEEAQQVAAVLIYNNPESKWAGYSHRLMSNYKDFSLEKQKSFSQTFPIMARNILNNINPIAVLYRLGESQRYKVQLPKDITPEKSDK